MDSSMKRPAHVRILGWKPEADGWLDVTVINPFASARQSPELRVPGGAVDAAERDKQRSIGGVAEAKGAVYLPFGSTVDGGLGLSALGLMSKLARKSSLRYDLDSSMSFARISFLVGYSLATSTCQMLEDQINFKRGHSFLF